MRGNLELIKVVKKFNKSENLYQKKYRYLNNLKWDYK